MGMLTLAFNIQPAKASGTVYIRADGSIDPPDAPIRRDGDIYTLTGNIIDVTDGIVIYRSNVVLDGAGHVLQGISGPWDSGMLWKGEGVLLQGVSNVTIRNLEIKLFAQGAFLGGVSGINIYGNNITNNYRGIRLHGCLQENYVFKNSITNNWDDGIYFDESSNSWIFENNLAECNILLENSTSNRIYENNITNGEIGLSWASNNNSIFENRVTDGIIGLFFSSHNNSIYRNYVTHDDGYCISLDDGSSHNNILENNITASGHTGISLDDGSSHNRIIGNNITNSYCGIEFDDYSCNNTISGNNLIKNTCGTIIMYDSKNNIIYNNNFINNTNQVYVSSGLFNVWDYGYPCGGNYWSNYTGVDEKSGHNQDELGGDGIGDAPYIFDADNRDHYPLMAPLSMLDAGTWNGEAYNVDIISNSTLSDFKLNATQKTLSFNVAGTEGKAGFCRVTIPNVIIQDLWEGNYTVLLNGEPWPFRNWTDTANAYIYLNYTHSEHQIVIIPEFPSFLVLSLFMMATVLTIIASGRKRFKHQIAPQQ
jgi:parallel beta-helix repeat protein